MAPSIISFGAYGNFASAQEVENGFNLASVAVGLPFCRSFLNRCWLSPRRIRSNALRRKAT